MKLFLVLFVCVAASFASSTLTGPIGGEYNLNLPSTDDVVDTNAYESATMYTTAYGSSGDYYVAEDFTPSGNFYITDVSWWTITTAATPAPSGVEVIFYTDAAPGPGSVLWSGVPIALNHIDTGVTFAGYVVWLTTATLPDTDYFTANSGTTYWVCMHRTDGSNFFIVLDTVVRGTECYRVDVTGGSYVPGSTTGSPLYDPADVFQIIEGTTTALDRSTWADIKTIF